MRLMEMIEKGTADYLTKILDHKCIPYIRDGHRILTSETYRARVESIVARAARGFAGTLETPDMDHYKDL